MATKRLALLAGAALLVAVPALVAAGQTYPIADGELETSDTTVAEGSQVTISGDGYAPGAEVVIVIESDPIELARVNADAEGAFSATVTIPEGMPPGGHTLKATGESATGGTRVLAMPVTLLGDDLPLTGWGMPAWSPFAAVGAIALGFVLIRLWRDDRARAGADI